MSVNQRTLPDKRLRILENSRLVRNSDEKAEVIEEHNPSLPDPSITRDEVDLECRRLRPMIYGADGIALAQNSHDRLVDVNIISHLALWIQEATRVSRKLWIDFPYEFQQDSPARVAALNIISIVAKANAPFLSYICKTPRQAELVDTQTRVNAGLVSMVYSLISQLLRFRPPDDGFRFDQSMLSRLSGDISCWNVALGLLSALLEHTPITRYCIIHGLNELETGEGAVKCEEFLRVLLSHSNRHGSRFSIIFTTSGLSRALYGVMDQKDRASSSESTKAIERRGVDLGFMEM